LRKEIYTNNTSQELDNNNYFNTSITINWSEKNIKAFSFRDESTSFILTNIITQHINNANILRLLRLKAKLAITKLQFAQRIDNYCRKHNNNYY